MKRSWFALIITVVLVTAIAPAYAKPRPPSTPRLSVWVQADPAWVHEAADRIAFTVYVENTARTAVDGVTVTLTAAWTETFTVPSIGAGERVAITATPREVSEFEEFSTCPEEGCTLPIQATALYGGLVSEAMSTVFLEVYPSCGFVDGVATMINGPCIWTPAEPGVWTVSVLPISTRPTGVSVTVRDHIPGNWCTLEDGTGGIISGRWKVGDDPITGQVYLPGSDGVLGNGVCLDGGIGGSEWFPIGNPESFYVVADGLVSVSRS